MGLRSRAENREQQYRGAKDLTQANELREMIEKIDWESIDALEHKLDEQEKGPPIRKKDERGDFLQTENGQFIEIELE